MERIYLDYAATTPVSAEVRRAMEPYFSDSFGNPGSVHAAGQEAMRAVDTARETIAGILGTQFRDIIFTGSATEANNVALRGVFSAAKRFFENEKPQIIISALEHESIADTAEDVRSVGADVCIIPVLRSGVVDCEALRDAMSERTALVSVMFVNNEIGSVQPLREIADIVREQRAKNSEQHEKHRSVYPIFHTDAVQAASHRDCSVAATGADLITLSAHKIHGPKGIGLLRVPEYIRNNGVIRAQIMGGGQEFALRSGTENVASIAGFACALKSAAQHREKMFPKLQSLRTYFWETLFAFAHDVRLNAPISEATAPHIVNIYFPGWAADELLTQLDRRGILAASGPACAARSVAPSRTLLACGYDRERARQSIRFSFGPPTSRADLDKALSVIKIVVNPQKK